MGTINDKPMTAALDLTAVVCNVLEDLAFLVSDEGESRAAARNEWLECAISYEGPVSGTLVCWCTRNFALQLTANLLGADPDDGSVQQQIGDALREFMNVVCGQFVTTVHGSGPVFNLSIPSARECPEPPVIDWERETAACSLSVSGEPFYCVYRFGATSESGSAI